MVDTVVGSSLLPDYCSSQFLAMLFTAPLSCSHWHARQLGIAGMLYAGTGMLLSILYTMQVSNLSYCHACPAALSAASLPAACCLLPAACCLLPAACCLLPAACCLLSTACCMLLLLLLRTRTIVPSSQQQQAASSSTRTAGAGCQQQEGPGVPWGTGINTIMGYFIIWYRQYSIYSCIYLLLRYPREVMRYCYTVVFRNRRVAPPVIPVTE